MSGDSVHNTEIVRVEMTPTGIPITDCETCRRRHPTTRKHCPTCGLAHLFACPQEVAHA